MPTLANPVRPHMGKLPVPMLRSDMTAEQAHPCLPLSGVLPLEGLGTNPAAAWVEAMEDVSPLPLLHTQSLKAVYIVDVKRIVGPDLCDHRIQPVISQDGFSCTCNRMINHFSLFDL